MHDIISDYENTVSNISNRIKELRQLKRSDSIMNHAAGRIQDRIDILETERDEMIHSIADMKKHRPVNHRSSNKIFR